MNLKIILFKATVRKDLNRKMHSICTLINILQN